jgi:hypothetical protein
MLRKTISLCRSILISRALLAAILVALLAWRPGLPALAQDAAGVQVRLSPASVQVAQEQTVDLAVEVSGVQDLYGFDLSLSFDPAAVQVVDADPKRQGVQVSQGLFLDPGLTAANEVDNRAGRLRFAMTQLNPSQPKSGSGPLVVLRLRGAAAAQASPVGLVEVQLVSREGGVLPAALAGAQVAVLASPPAGPTPTPLPTQHPGVELPDLPDPTLPAATEPPAAAVLESPTATPPAAEAGSPLPASPTPLDASVQPAAPTQVAAADTGAAGPVNGEQGEIEVQVEAPTVEPTLQPEPAPAADAPASTGSAARTAAWVGLGVLALGIGISGAILARRAGG